MRSSLSFEPPPKKSESASAHRCISPCEAPPSDHFDTTPESSEFSESADSAESGYSAPNYANQEAGLRLVVMDSRSSRCHRCIRASEMAPVADASCARGEAGSCCNWRAKRAVIRATRSTLERTCRAPAVAVAVAVASSIERTDRVAFVQAALSAASRHAIAHSVCFVCLDSVVKLSPEVVVLFKMRIRNVF